MAFGKVIEARYFGSFLAIAGCQGTLRSPRAFLRPCSYPNSPSAANVPAVLAYQANNILSHSKRAVSSAVVIGFGGVGGIFASLVCTSP
jgi:hypothetical protein